jgi:hypothetical protein
VREPRSALAALLGIDDVHWADQASLRFLNYLGGRLEELPIAVVAAARPAESHERSPLLAALTADPSAEVLVLAPLSERAVAELVRLGLGAAVDPVFATACHEVTGGVPFLVKELVRTIAEQGIEPTATAASQVAALAPRTVSQSVVQRLSRLSSAAREPARAAAVLGGTDLRLAADLADLDPQPPQPRPTSSPRPGSSSRVGRSASCTRSSGGQSRQTSRPASEPRCTRRRHADSRPKTRLRTASRPTSSRPIRPRTTGSSNRCGRLRGPRS